MSYSPRTWLLFGVVFVASLAFLVIFQGFTERAKTQIEDQNAPAEQPSFPTPPGEQFAKDRIIVKLDQGATQADLATLNRHNDATTKEDLPNSSLNVVDLPSDLGVGEAVKSYEASPDVAYAEPD